MLKISSCLDSFNHLLADILSSLSASSVAAETELLSRSLMRSELSPIFRFLITAVSIELIDFIDALKETASTTPLSSSASISSSFPTTLMSLNAIIFMGEQTTHDSIPDRFFIFLAPQSQKDSARAKPFDSALKNAIIALSRTGQTRQTSSPDLITFGEWQDLHKFPWQTVFPSATIFTSSLLATLWRKSERSLINGQQTHTTALSCERSNGTPHLAQLLRVIMCPRRIFSLSTLVARSLLSFGLFRADC
mmetsp:Transcript_1623/g.3694  ORF Transcript_1623/g.3694 Transcript_1623/m.3694 type:complete len:250 (-) Transcript_1623:1007-1756(-)